MQNSPPRSRMNLQHKLTLTHGAVTLAAIIAAEGVVVGVLAARETWAWITRQPASAQPTGGLNVALVTIGAALAGLVLGAWASRHSESRNWYCG